MSETKYRYGIIGTGIPWREEGSSGFGMAHAHYPSMMKNERAELVAISELQDSRAQYFQQKQNTNVSHYQSYTEMLAEENLDIVSICTWPHLHAEITVAAVNAGVKAIYCEKPMATNWGDCKRMKVAADEKGVLLCFNHQRRHIKLFQEVRRAVQEGEIGDLVQIEAECGNLYDWGTHWLDMMFFYNNDEPAEWVIGQINSSTENVAFGAKMEDQAVLNFKWKNGVHGTMVTGDLAKIGAVHRLMGTDGVIEVLNERNYRILGKGIGEWKHIEVPQGDWSDLALAANDVVRALDEPGYKPLISADHAIQSTEIIFATYRSSQIHGRVDLPLSYDGNGLLDLMSAGAFGK